MRTNPGWMVVALAVVMSAGCPEASGGDEAYECGSVALGAKCTRNEECQCGLRCVDRVCLRNEIRDGAVPPVPTDGGAPDGSGGGGSGGSGGNEAGGGGSGGEGDDAGADQNR